MECAMAGPRTKSILYHLQAATRKVQPLGACGIRAREKSHAGFIPHRVKSIRAQSIGMRVNPFQTAADRAGGPGPKNRFDA